MMLRVGSRRRAVLWAAGIGAAAILFLGANGTLAGWTQAGLATNTNTTAVGQAVALNAAQGTNTCSTSADPGNAIACTTINHYDGTGTPLLPGDEKYVDVTFRNIGLANASRFTMTPGACSRSGSGSLNLCTAAGNLQVQIRCSPGASYNAGTAWADLSYTYAVVPTLPKTHTATGAELNAGGRWTCRTWIKLLDSADNKAQGVGITQQFTWKLIR